MLLPKGQKATCEIEANMRTETRPTAWRSVAASALLRLLLKKGDLAREAVNCNAVLGGCNRMRPHSNRQNNGSLAPYHVGFWPRSKAGTKQVSLRAVFVPALLRRRSADGLARSKKRAFRTARRHCCMDCTCLSGAPRGTRPPFETHVNGFSIAAT